MPNCCVSPLYINEEDIERPLLAFFAVTDIEGGSELHFSYQGEVSVGFPCAAALFTETPDRTARE